MAKTPKAKATDKQLRAAGYARTSGGHKSGEEQDKKKLDKKQQDSTSIPNQRERINDLCVREGWQFVKCYVDECKTGSKIAGREAFQEMLRDAAAGKFDIVVVNDIDRFGRDDLDIVSTAKTLKTAFKIDTVDTKGKYDTRDRHRKLTNWIMAGIADDERLRIAERCISGRMRKAADGFPWSGKKARPIGRDYDEATGKWYVTDRGKQIAAILKRYVQGEAGTTELGKELGVAPSRICTWVHHGQLAGQYEARFKCPDLEIDTGVPVPGMPEVISEKLLGKVKATMTFKRTNSRSDLKRYVLTGFLRCSVCGKSLTGREQRNTGRRYYHQHNGPECKIKTVPGDDLEAAILDYLYQAFLDKPAFDKAVLAAAPSATDRKALDNERSDMGKQLAAVDLQINRLADAVAGGMDLQLLLGKHEHLKADREALGRQLEALEAKLSSLPDPKMTQLEARLTRVRLRQMYKGRDWRKLSYDDQRRFLLHLFSETTMSNGNGIFVTKDAKGVLVVTFKGQVDFEHLLTNGKPLTKKLYEDFERWRTWYEKRRTPCMPNPYAR
ncbi:MAG: recombinase family protein [Planctomycetia bacterium]|nr:recombinase family protein [Planctomycetia bacterium]